MRLLFELDMKNYDVNAPVYKRPSVRGIILRGGRIAMVHSLKYDYYKFPGGGMEDGESLTDTLLREVREESGLIVVPESVKEFGLVRRIEAGDEGTVFEQDNYYYVCEADDASVGQELDDYEADERFTLEYVTAEQAIASNRKPDHGPKSPIMIEREARVLELLLDEKYIER